MSLQAIETKFEGRGRKIGSVLLFRPMDALDFIKACLHEGLPLVGVEGFKLVDNKIQPCQEHSNDIADTCLDSAQFYEETKRFIHDRNDQDVWFEVVIATAR